MPGVVTLKQNSETSSKKSYFRGHNWASLALLQSLQEKIWALPLIGTIDQGFEYLDDTEQNNSLTTRIIQQAQTIAQSMNRPCYLILDAFFAVGPAFKQASSTWALFLKEPWIHIITRAKKSIVAYEPILQSPHSKKSRGRPKKYGTARKLYKEYEHLDNDRFITGTCVVYGKKETVYYVAKKLYWKPINDILLFVMAKTSRGFIVLMSSDTTIEPLRVIELYCHRIAIEVFFSILKNLFGGLCYHFWSRVVERQQRKPRKNKKASAPNPVYWETITMKKEAIERFVNLCVVAIGICQMMSARFYDQIWKENKLWFRTFSNIVPSVYVTKVFITRLIEDNFREIKHGGIFQIIAEKQKESQEVYNPCIQELPKDEQQRITESASGDGFVDVLIDPQRLISFIRGRFSKLKKLVYH